MKFRHLPSLLASNFVVAHATFSNSNNTYSYKSRDLDVKEGDQYVVVTKTGPQIVTVKKVTGPETLDFDADYDYRWLAQKVDLTWYTGILEQEAKLVQELHAAERKKYIQEFIDNLKKDNPGIEAVIEAHQVAVKRL